MKSYAHPSLQVVEIMIIRAGMRIALTRVCRLKHGAANGDWAEEYSTERRDQMMKASRRVGLGIIAVLLGFVVVMPSWALTIDPDLCQGNHVGSCPTDPWDWMTAEITGSGTLTMTMTGHLASDSDNRITNWWFNLDPVRVPTGAILTITQTSLDPLVDKVNSSAADSTNPFTVTIAQNSQSVDGGGAFDLEFAFFDGPPAKRFDGSDVLTFTITCSGCSGVFDDTVFDFSSTVPP